MVINRISLALLTSNSLFNSHFIYKLKTITILNKIYNIYRYIDVELLAAADAASATRTDNFTGYQVHPLAVPPLHSTCTKRQTAGK